jgi:hypothetical protein
VSAVLSHSPAQIVAQLLINLGLANVHAEGGTDPTWPVRWNNETTSPNNALFVFDTTGFGNRNRRYGFQVVIRGGTHAVGYPKANAVHRGLDAIVDISVVTIDAVQYCVSTRCTNDPMRMGSDGSTTRQKYSVNGLAYVVKRDP